MFHIPEECIKFVFTCSGLVIQSLTIQYITTSHGDLTGVEVECQMNWFMRYHYILLFFRGGYNIVNGSQINRMFHSFDRLIMNCTAQYDLKRN